MECADNMLRLFQWIILSWWSGLDTPTDTEIDEDDLGWVCWRAKYILGLDIPMNETAFMYMFQGREL